jgi:ketosteroid isomerase-like protein
LSSGRESRPFLSESESALTIAGDARSSSWQEFRVLHDEVRDLGDRVLALGKLEGRGRGSGVWVESPVGSVTDFRDGRAWRTRVFSDHGEALRAAGLAE